MSGTASVVALPRLGRLSFPHAGHRARCCLGLGGRSCPPTAEPEQAPQGFRPECRRGSGAQATVRASAMMELRLTRLVFRVACSHGLSSGLARRIQLVRATPSAGVPGPTRLRGRVSARNRTPPRLGHPGRSHFPARRDRLDPAAWFLEPPAKEPSGSTSLTWPGGNAMAGFVEAGTGCQARPALW
jgi:hypothetical protein